MKAVGRNQSVIIAAVLAILIVAGGYLGLVKPEKKSVSGIKTQATSAEQANSSLQLQLSVLKGLAKQLPVQQAELAKIKTKVPDHVQLASLLRQLVVAANDSGVNLTSLTPTQPAPLVGAPGISYVDLTINFTGGYAEVEQFDSTLESLSRTLLVKDFSLSGGGAATGTSTGATGTTGTTNTSSASSSLTAVFNGRVLVKDNTPVAVATPSAAPTAAAK